MPTAAEIWITCPDATDYAVSNLGRVKRIIEGKTNARKGSILAQHTDQRGYVSINLRVSGKVHSFWAHRLICRAFYGPQPSPRHQVAHSNGRRDDNQAGNLRWATIEENKADQLIHGTRVRGEIHPFAKLTVDDVRAIRNDRRAQRKIAQSYGIGQTTVSRIKTRVHWGHIL